MLNIMNNFSSISKVVLTTLLFGIVKISMASDFIGSLKSDEYISPEETIKCKLPIIHTDEELSENYMLGNEQIGAGYDGLIAKLSRTQRSLDKGNQFKYIEKSMDLKQKLLAIEKYWIEAFAKSTTQSDSTSEFIRLNKKLYRLYTVTLNLDSKPFSSMAHLFTIENNNIILYLISDFGKVEPSKLKQKALSFFEKCSFSNPYLQTADSVSKSLLIL
jgi:hypothetical protein